MLVAYAYHMHTVVCAFLIKQARKQVDIVEWAEEA